MFSISFIRAALLLPAVLRLAFAQSATTSASSYASSTPLACNNSPNLCSRPYNNITYLGAHDSPFVRNASNGFSVSGNQFYDSPTQLSAGVRLLSAQVMHPNASSEWHVCHTSCDLLDAGSLRNWLGQISAWMTANPNEVVTLLLVNSGGASASDLASDYQASGIVKHAYVPTTKSASHTWPTLQSLITSGTRLVSFVTSLPDNTVAPYLMDEFTYIFENGYENLSPNNFSCVPNRPSSVAGNTQQALNAGLMPLMNHFLYEQDLFGIEQPNDTYVTTINAASGGVGNLGSAASECSSQYGKAPIFILVDFFNVGPAIDTVDRLNGISSLVGRTTLSPAVMSQKSGVAAIAVERGMLYLTVLAGALLFVQ